MRTYTGFDGVTRTVKQWNGYDYVQYQGCAVRPRHLDSMLAAAEYTPGWGRLNLMQGGLSGSVSASAKTHLYLDAGDISVKGKSRSLVWKFCANLFENGNLPFPRGFTSDSFQNNKHIHDLWYMGGAGHPSLVAQENEWRKYRGDGLIGPARYTGPDLTPGLWAESMFNPMNRIDFEEPVTMYVTADALQGLNRARKSKIVRPRGRELEFVAKVRRWRRWNYLTKYETFYAADYLSVEPPSK